MDGWDGKLDVQAERIRDQRKTWDFSLALVPPQSDRQLNSILQNVLSKSNQGSPDVIGKAIEGIGECLLPCVALALVPTQRPPRIKTLCCLRRCLPPRLPRRYQFHRCVVIPSRQSLRTAPCFHRHPTNRAPSLLPLSSLLLPPQIEHP